MDFFLEIKSIGESTFFHSGLIMIEPLIYAKKTIFLNFHEVTPFLHARSHMFGDRIHGLISLNIYLFWQI